MEGSPIDTPQDDHKTNPKEKNFSFTKVDQLKNSQLRASDSSEIQDLFKIKSRKLENPSSVTRLSNP
ncbi:hypothetical protein CEXT_250071 [Caerostris extrusa]|uniref:Uncharacterized protein n=1 Tax=Caerostris extrusa TaxID=172846 RepID=A0AAV4XEY5_CAEEX|nr:hypothetical protein CEXT_250071 [Caerostris extrusa]